MNQMDILPRVKTEITPQAILTEVCCVWGIDPYNLLGRTRTHHIAFARQVAMVLVKEMGGYSRTDTAQLFNRDYTTVLWAERNVKRRLANKEVKELINKVISKLQSPTPQG